MTCQKNHALTGLSSSEESWHYMTTIRVPPEASSEIHPSLPTFPSIDRNPSVDGILTEHILMFRYEQTTASGEDRERILK